MDDNALISQKLIDFPKTREWIKWSCYHAKGPAAHRMKTKTWEVTLVEGKAGLKNS